MLGTYLSLATDIAGFSQAQGLAQPKQGAVRHYVLLLESWLKKQSDLAPSVASRIKALRCESSPQRFAEGLLEIARIYLKAGDFQTPQELYSLALKVLPSTKIHQDQRDQIQSQLSALQGQGSFRDSLKLGLKRLPHELFSPTVVAMGVGSLMNPLGARFLGNLLKGSVGQTSRVFLSRAGGMALDALSFTGVQQGMALAAGQVTKSFSHDLMHAGLILSSLRVTGSLARSTLAAKSVQRALNHFGKLTQRTAELSLPLMAEYQGLLQANQWGAKLGLGSVGPHAGLETLFTMIHFRLANSWLKLSPYYTSLHRNLTKETEFTLRTIGSRSLQRLNSYISRWGGPGPLSFYPRPLAFAGAYHETLSPEIEASNGESLDFIHSYLGAQGKALGGRAHGRISVKDLKEQTEQLHGQIVEELSLARAQLAQMERSRTTDVTQAYENELAGLERRFSYWQEHASTQRQYSGKEGTQYLCDIVIGQEILLDRVLQLSGRIFGEGFTGEGVHTGSVSSPRPGQLGEPRTRELVGSETAPKQGIFPALKNRDVGYGNKLSLRPHQEAALNTIRARWNLIQGRLEASSPQPLNESLFCGTILMPVGGGKSRTMIAALGAGIELGAFQASRGDKYVILGHTDRIHKQNLKRAEMLRPYFRRKFNRSLRISEYKADTKDLNGDVVVVSVPTVNQEASRATFLRDLKAKLGSEGRIAMVGVDEVHHLSLGKNSGRQSWPELVAGLREVSPHLFQLGFTATPTRGERHVLYRISELELMCLGVTPRRYLVRVQGEDLSQLKVGKTSGDFNQRELVSTLISMPKRNQGIYRALETRALRRTEQSPSGRDQLGATLVFAADLKHAKMMAEDYRRYFVSGSAEGLRGRRLLFLGQNQGKVKKTELTEALNQYDESQLDGIIALLSGHTNKKVEADVIEAWEQGRVEAIFTVDSLVEGADLYMATNQIGARPTFSLIKKRQEGGRSNRRDPKEVTADGRLVSDNPKVLFDVIDNYYDHQDTSGRRLVYYGNSLGVRGYYNSPYGELFDALAGSSVAEVDLQGRAGGAWDKPRPPKAEDTSVPKIPIEDKWSNLVQRLQQILEERYAGDMEALALDLGEPVEYVADLLEGRGWVGEHWFLRRMATLLYQERDELAELWHEAKGIKASELSDDELGLVRTALKQYRTWEGVSDEEAINSAREGSHPLGISGNGLLTLGRGTLTERSWRKMSMKFIDYFERKLGEKGFIHMQAANEQRLALRAAVFARRSWPIKAHSAQEALLFEGRMAVVRRFNWGLPSEIDIDGVHKLSVRSPLNRWLRRETIQYGKNLSANEFYSQVRVLLLGLGIEQARIDGLIEAAIFEEQGWESETSTSRGRLLLKARQAVASNYGGILPANTGIFGVPRQRAGSTLTTWLRDEVITYSNRLSPSKFYSQVRTLLLGLGVKKAEVNSLIEAAIFEEHPGWDFECNSAQERLLLEARRVVASNLGGTIPERHSILGLRIQSTNSAINRWLRGERVEFSRKSFYNQVEALLVGLEMPVAEARRLVEAAREESGV